MMIQNTDNQLTMIATADAYGRSDWKNISLDNIQGIAANQGKTSNQIERKGNNTIGIYQDPLHWMRHVSS